MSASSSLNKNSARVFPNSVLPTPVGPRKRKEPIGRLPSRRPERESLIALASLFTALGFFDKLVNWARCGLIIPITGFAHSMTSAAIEFKREGYVTGLGANIFKLAGTVILYGIVSAYIFGIIRYLIFGGV